MPQETLVMEYADTYQSPLHSNNEMVTIDSPSSLDYTGNFVFGEFTLPRKHWFMSSKTSLQIEPTFSATLSAYLIKPSLRPHTFNVSNFWSEATRIERPLRTVRHPSGLGPFFEMQETISPSASIQIPHQLAEIADESALNMLLSEADLISHATRLYESALREFSNLGLSAECSLTSYVEPESEEVGNLLLGVKIHGKPYAEILQIWDKLSMSLPSDLPAEIQKKLSIVVDEA